MGHLKTITKHRHEVMKNCFRAGIPWRGLVHDLSKYSPTEFFNGVRYFQGDRSPNEGEREAKGYSEAWMHHKGRNRHHFEYWTDVNPMTHRYEPVEMPTVFLAEMFCDRVAASKIYKKEKYTDASALEYFNRAKTRDKMHAVTGEKLEKWLTVLAREGEDAAFRLVRDEVKRAGLERKAKKREKRRKGRP